MAVLRHSPDDSFVAAFIAWDTQLMTEQQRQSSVEHVQHWAGIMKACAQLGIELLHDFVARLVDHIVCMAARVSTKQAQNLEVALERACAWLAWSLAVLDVLDIAKMQALLDMLQSGHVVKDAQGHKQRSISVRSTGPPATRIW